jgi:hypothetical protein
MPARVRQKAFAEVKTCGSRVPVAAIWRSGWSARQRSTVASVSGPGLSRQSTVVCARSAGARPDRASRSWVIW